MFSNLKQQVLKGSKLLSACLIFVFGNVAMAKAPVVLMTDFGLTDGAVSTMKGVIYTVDPSLTISDLSHNVEAFNVQEASYRLYQVMQYYPKGTVFVSVVDPGVGTSRKSIVAETNNGYFIVTPDNGTLTNIAAAYGIKEIREIDETKNRLENSEKSHTFYGRDVFAYTGGKLAADKITFAEVGPHILKEYIKFPIQTSQVKNNAIHGTVIILDGDYGNLWTNISPENLKQIGAEVGKQIQVEILDKKDKVIYRKKIHYGNTFGDVKVGSEVSYLNSLGNFAIAINQGNFAKKYNIKPEFKIIVKM
ncbi:S-adenosyl-l-methionine hydroxide adenosyltransferase family protein [Pigmentibacter sp. JX0631]|uniref:SAM hydrolase/SAM-dependent halogenase family protein n=1 Tax=Pigmentibacter sp. JX0631 TaxID=2976982 RepID=UPI0024687189|nr:S-adenosyl-l-methionine hydroxide adenosyltransferase family protein [Pigmentibacter sp. JX0631]WGL61372.1 S-adenosyl-l-methionine hydroxide adenosyltransferase family protein [Pigmentibacter sp. JX0631]